jgi:hypothetical protein
MNKINKLLNKLEDQVDHYSKFNQAISEGNVGWHIVHSCLVISSVCTVVCKSNPDTYIKRFSFKAFLVLLLNTFPRGKAKAPSFTVPSEELSPASILKSIQAARTSLELLANASKNQYFTHPIFGDLNTGQTLKFLGVHTNHHLKIIKDILK